MLTARHGRLLLIALVVHFALLLPAADLAHDAAHPDDTACEVCLHLGTFQHGIAPSLAADSPPRYGVAPYRALALTRVSPAPGRATARGPPSV